MQTADRRIFQAEETASTKALRLQRPQFWKLTRQPGWLQHSAEEEADTNEVNEVGSAQRYTCIRPALISRVKGDLNTKTKTQLPQTALFLSIYSLAATLSLHSIIIALSLFTSVTHRKLTPPYMLYSTSHRLPVSLSCPFSHISQFVNSSYCAFWGSQSLFISKDPCAHVLFSEYFSSFSGCNGNLALL